MKINVIKISYVQETFKDLLQEENISSFKHDECNRETATTNHIMVNRNQST